MASTVGGHRERMSLPARSHFLRKTGVHPRVKPEGRLFRRKCSSGVTGRTGETLRVSWMSDFFAVA